MSTHKITIGVQNSTERTDAVATAMNWLAERVGPVDVVNTTEVDETDYGHGVSLVVTVKDDRDYLIEHLDDFQHIKKYE